MARPRARRPSTQAAARGPWRSSHGATRRRCAETCSRTNHFSLSLHRIARSPMNFDYSPKVQALREKLLAFFDEHIYPNEAVYHEEVERNRAKGNAWVPTEIVEKLKIKAREAGLWNLFLPDSTRGAGLTNLEYAPLCEIMGRVYWAPEVFNCNAPDTGNMETIERYGSEDNKREWLEPLLQGQIRSAFLMTEPEVASSDATNIQTSIVRDGDHYVINGHKWWSSDAGDPRCK